MPITKTKIKKRDIYRTEPTIKHVSGHRPLFIQLITTTEKKNQISLYVTNRKRSYQKARHGH